MASMENSYSFERKSSRDLARLFYFGGRINSFSRIWDLILSVNTPRGNRIAVSLQDDYSESKTYLVTGFFPYLLLYSTLAADHRLPNWGAMFSQWCCPAEEDMGFCSATFPPASISPEHTKPPHDLHVLPAGQPKIINARGGSTYMDVQLA